MPGGDIGISLIAQAGIRAVASDVAVMSGYLSMSVPFLAAALAYGLSKATILATSVLAVGQDAASSAAHEGTTGNLSLANTGYDTHRFATLEGPPDPYLRPCRYRPLHRLRAGWRRVHRRPGRHAGGRCRQRHQPHPGRGGAAHGIARHQPRAARGRRGPRPSRGTGRRRRARRATPPSPTPPALVERYSHDVSDRRRRMRAASPRARVRSAQEHCNPTSTSWQRSAASRRTRRWC